MFYVCKNAILLQLWALFTHLRHKATTVVQNHNNMTDVTQINLEQLIQCTLLTQQTNKHNDQTNNADEMSL